MRGATPQTMAGMSPAIFQSTRPVRGATLALTGADIDRKFQSTRPVRGATGAVGGHGVVQMISIHAPRAGRDTIAAISAMHSS